MKKSILSSPEFFLQHIFKRSQFVPLPEHLDQSPEADSEEVWEAEYSLLNQEEL